MIQDNSKKDKNEKTPATGRGNNFNELPEDDDISAYYPDGDAGHMARDDHDEEFLNETIKKKKKLRRKNGRLKKSQIGLIITIFLIYSLVIVTAAWVIFYKPTPPSDNEIPFDITPVHDEDNPPLDNESDNNAADTANDDKNSGVVKTDEYKVRDGVYNILVVGHDREAFLADVTMLVNVNTKDNSITVMQIPRDTLVSLDVVTNKINAVFPTYRGKAYRTGLDGDEATSAAIKEYEKILEQALCINIHHTAVMNLNGFQNIVNVLGGVDLYVPSAMYYSDPEQNLYIDIPAGYQHLDGYQSECFVRFRSGYLQADLGRVNAQKIFLTALFNQAKAVVKSVDVKKLTEVAGEIMKYLNTDMTASDIMFYAKAMLGIDLENINMLTIPGNMVGDYYVLNRSAALGTVNKYFNIYEKEISDSIFDRKSTFNFKYDSDTTSAYYADSDYTYDDMYNAKMIDDDSIYIPRY